MNCLEIKHKNTQKNKLKTETKYFEIDMQETRRRHFGTE